MMKCLFLYNIINTFVNDSKCGNCLMRMVLVNDTPHLCLFSKRNLSAGEELRNDYAAPNLWWRKEVILRIRKQIYLFMSKIRT